jgi:serine/threonine-protein kinase
MQNSRPRSSIDVGAVIAETYTIEALLGEGGMGAVFLASHKRLPGKKVAIKLLHAELTSDEILARFKREAEIASRLAHPNIVAVHDYNVMPDGTPYVVMDYLEGASLAAQLKQGPLPLDRAMSIMRQVGSALAVAHREGIVHRDLKPQNIFLVPGELDGRTIEIAKVLDFGISKIRGSDTVKTQESALLGTPQYMAPEQATGQHDKVDERTDLFALGAIACEMITGNPAFTGASIPEVVFKVVYEEPTTLPASTPTHVVAAIARAMAKVQDQRFPNVGAFIEALTGQALAPVKPASLPPASRNTEREAFDQTVGSGDHGPPARGSAPTIDSQSKPLQPKRPKRRVWPFVVAGVALVAGGAVIAMSRGNDAPPMTVVPPPVTAVSPDAAIAMTPAIDAPPAPVDASPRAKPPATAKKSIDAAVATADDDEPGDEDTMKRLADADHALTAGDYVHAEQLANSVINGETSRAAQKGRAHVVHGIVECAFHNDRGLALADLRAVIGPKQRHRLLQGCAAVGMQLGGQ